MTDPMMHLRSLVEKTTDADVLRDMISFAAERLMEMEVGGLTGVAYGEKSPARLVQRTGHRELDSQTRAGTVERSRIGLSIGVCADQSRTEPIHRFAKHLYPDPAPRMIAGGDQSSCADAT